jgi:hypothetical protein
MTALQATVARHVRAVGTGATTRSLGAATRGAEHLLFTVGTLGALYAGRLLERFGDWKVSTLRAAAVAAGMGCVLVGGPLVLLLDPR